MDDNKLSVFDRLNNLKEGVPDSKILEKFTYGNIKSVDSVKVLGTTVVVNFTIEESYGDVKSTKSIKEKRSIEFDIVLKDKYSSARTEDIQKLFNSMINKK